MIPGLSNSYWWSASAVAGQNAKSPIYVLAEEPVEVLLSNQPKTLTFCQCKNLSFAAHSAFSK